MRVQTILVPVDFSEGSKRALHWAVDLAKRHDAQLHLLHVMAAYGPEWYGEAEPLPQVDALRNELETDAREGLEAMAPDPDRSGVASNVTVVHDLNVAGAILEETADAHADLIVMGTHGRSGIEHALLGSVAEKVVRRAPQMVLTVGKEAAESPSVERVLAPTDFSKPSKQALRTAKQLAATYDAQLDVLFVAEERVVPIFRDTGLPGVSLLKMDPEIVNNAVDAIDHLSDEVGGPEVAVQGHVAKGKVAPRIIDFTESHGVDLIVMATRGLTGLNHFLIGSVAERVVRRAPCPVLTMHAAEEEEGAREGDAAAPAESE